jgi:hypothetical protein
VLLQPAAGQVAHRRDDLLLLIRQLEVHRLSV